MCIFQGEKQEHRLSSFLHVTCGGTHQVIHTDRIQPVVRGEQDKEVTSNKQEAAASKQIDDKKRDSDMTTTKRRTKRPAYLDDYCSF